MTQTVKNKKAIQRKKKKAMISKLVGIVLLIFSIIICSNIAKEVVTTLSLKKQADVIEQELALLRQENTELLQTKEKLEDPNYVTTYARGEYMFSKGDEKLFRLPSKK